MKRRVMHIKTDNLFCAVIQQAVVELQSVSIWDFMKSSVLSINTKRMTIVRNVIDAYEFIFSDRLSNWINWTQLNLDVDCVRRGVRGILEKRQLVYEKLKEGVRNGKNRKQKCSKKVLSESGI